MGKTYIQKSDRKYILGLIEKPPINLLKKYNRHNFDLGLFRSKKKKLTEKIINKDSTLWD